MSKTIMVVDDQRESVEKLIEILNGLGYTTVYESDCVLGMQRYRKGGIDAVIADGSAFGDILAEGIRKRDNSTPIALYSYAPFQYKHLEKIKVGVLSKLDGPQGVVSYIQDELKRQK